ncbi:CAIB/BAIF family protein [Fulvivirga imtechensis AK7]|uniref:CAIB/BAIF family protein n=2 Tax=Fulvivirga TaxID=396811 RepID=L8JSC1_9BACT|nr:CAIB/BAIF family protein [Fulvivirga imtechensis AK7]
MQDQQFFSGVKVIELASVLAGPSVGQFFAELGGDVVKIENPATGGDVTRSWKLKEETGDQLTAYFTSINWGKRSVSLDISKPEGLSILYRMVEKADIIIASYKPGDAKKLKVDYRSLCQINPNIIYGQITGYGTENVKVGYDAIIQAEAGFMSMNGEPGGAPTKMPVALMDILAGHHLKEGILLRLIHKLKTGEGGKVSVSLIESAVASLANQGANWLVAGKVPSRQGSAHPNIAPYGDIFVTKDSKQIILAVGTDRQFVNLCKVLEMTAIANDLQYASNALRVKHRQPLYDLLQGRICRYNQQYLIDELNALKVPVGAIHEVPEALQMPEVQHLLMTGGGVRGVRTFVAHFADEERKSGILPPPRYGEHTQQVLMAELGLSASDIQRLSENKVV